MPYHKREKQYDHDSFMSFCTVKTQKDAQAQADLLAAKLGSDWKGGTRTIGQHWSWRAFVPEARLSVRPWPLGDYRAGFLFHGPTDTMHFGHVDQDPRVAVAAVLEKVMSHTRRLWAQVHRGRVAFGGEELNTDGLVAITESTLIQIRVTPALSDALLQARKAVGLTLRAAEKEIGKPFTYLQRLETGGRVMAPSMVLLRKIANAYGTDMSTLLIAAGVNPGDK